MTIPITMPRLSDTMEQGTVIKWHVQQGDAVSSGDTIADVETDKATMEMQAFDDGTVAEIISKEGDTVDVGATIAVLAEEGEESSTAAKAEAPTETDTQDAPAEQPEVIEAPSAEPTPEPVAEQSAVSQPAATPAASPASAAGHEHMRVTPVARRIADDNNLDLSLIHGSGPQGRIIKRDVLQAIESSKENQAAVPPAAIVTSDKPTEMAQVVTPVSTTALVAGDHTAALTPMRQTIARRLVESKTTIPHYQVTMKFNMDPLLELRKSLNDQLAHHEVKLSVNDFLVRGCALAMADHPDFNASFGGDHILYHGQVNIGVAISLPAEKGGGLVVATIRDADLKSLRLISAETKVLAEKARTRGLTVEEMSDATFTLSNLGMFGVEHFTAIINPPNSAILAVGASVQLPVVRDGQVVVGHEMQGTLSLDHRVIDGAMAAQYLQTLKELIETPTMLLV